MNTLQSFIETHHLDEVNVMNALQENGVISDLAVFSSEVAECDCPAAIQWLEANFL